MKLFSELCGRSSLTCTWKLWLDWRQNICVCCGFPRIFLPGHILNGCLCWERKGSYWKVVRKDIYLSYYSPSVYTLDFPNMLRSISNVWFISRSMQSNSDFPLRSPIPTTCIRHAMFQSMLFYSHFCAHSSPMPVPGTVPPTMQLAGCTCSISISVFFGLQVYIYIYYLSLVCIIVFKCTLSIFAVAYFVYL